jgi:hypothetical protein
MADSTQALAYEEALRALTQQQAVLDGLRSRASTLLGITSISTSFLGGIVLDSGKLEGLTWIPVCTFVIGMLAIWILLPTPGWKFSLDISILISDYVEGHPPAELPEMYRDLALHFRNHHRDNEAHLGRLFLLYRLASGLLVAEVSSWLIVLGLRWAMSEEPQPNRRDPGRSETRFELFELTSLIKSNMGLWLRKLAPLSPKPRAKAVLVGLLGGGVFLGIYLRSFAAFIIPVGSGLAVAALLPVFNHAELLSWLPYLVQVIVAGVYGLLVTRSPNKP